jgi:hypothetical protein
MFDKPTRIPAEGKKRRASALLREAGKGITFSCAPRPSSLLKEKTVNKPLIRQFSLDRRKKRFYILLKPVEEQYY